MSNPTRIDGGVDSADLRIEIIINPVTKQISINENTNDPIMFNYLMGQALQTHATYQMKLKAERARAQAAVSS